MHFCCSARAQETIRDWRARSSSSDRWATTWSRSTSHLGWSSSSPGCPSGWTGMRHQPESRSESPLCWRWQRWCLRPTRLCPRYPTSNPSTSTWARVSSWSSPVCWVKIIKKQKKNQKKIFKTQCASCTDQLLFARGLANWFKSELDGLQLVNADMALQNWPIREQLSNIKKKIKSTEII